MDDQGFPGGERRQQELAATRQRPYRSSLQPFGKALGKRDAQVGPANEDASETGAPHGRLELAANRFDFGKFRHLIEEIELLEAPGRLLMNADCTQRSCAPELKLGPTSQRFQQPATAMRA